MNRRGFFLVLLASILWGTTGTSQALAPAGAQPLAIGALRLVIGGAALLAVALISSRRSGALPIRPLAPGPVLAAAICMALYQVLFFAGVARTGVAVGTMVGIGSSPVLAGLLGWLLRGERPGWRWAAATALAVAGCALLGLAGGEIRVDGWGLLLAVGAGGAYATFSLVGKGLLASQPVEVVMAAAFSLGALLLAPALLAQDLTWLASARGLLVMLHLGLLATALAYTLYGQGLRRLPLATAVTISLAEPLTAGVLGVLLLREQLTFSAGAGIALIAAGLVVLSIHAGGRAPASSATSTSPAP